MREQHSDPSQNSISCRWKWRSLFLQQMTDFKDLQFKLEDLVPVLSFWWVVVHVFIYGHMDGIRLCHGIRKLFLHVNWIRLFHNVWYMFFDYIRLWFLHWNLHVFDNFNWIWMRNLHWYLVGLGNWNPYFLRDFYYYRMWNRYSVFFVYWNMYGFSFFLICRTAMIITLRITGGHQVNTSKEKNLQVKSPIFNLAPHVHLGTITIFVHNNIYPTVWKRESNKLIMYFNCSILPQY